MKKVKEEIEIVHGTGNVFRDLGDVDADAKQLKVILAAEIIKKLDRDGLTVRKVQEQTGIDAGDLTRIRKAKLDRFTVDRLMGIVNKLGSRIEVSIKVRAGRRHPEHAPVI